MTNPLARLLPVRLFGPFASQKPLSPPCLYGKGFSQKPVQTESNPVRYRKPSSLNNFRSYACEFSPKIVRNF
jgi:hypothetical protein